MEGLPSFCGWGRDFSLSLEKEFKGAAGVILWWISFALWNSLDRMMPSCGEFSLLLFIGTLYDFKGFQLVRISVSFCDLGVELYNQDLVKFLRRCLFQDIFFQMAGSGLAPASEDVHWFTVLWSGSKDCVCLFTATGLSSCIASFETTGNLEACTFLRWLWIRWCVVFVCFCFAGLGMIRILSRCWTKKCHNIRQNGHWMLETSC